MRRLLARCDHYTAGRDVLSFHFSSVFNVQLIVSGFLGDIQRSYAILVVLEDTPMFQIINNGE